MPRSVSMVRPGSRQDGWSRKVADPDPSWLRLFEASEDWTLGEDGWRFSATTSEESEDGGAG